MEQGKSAPGSGVLRILKRIGELDQQAINLRKQRLVHQEQPPDLIQKIDELDLLHIDAIKYLYKEIGYNR